MADRRNEQESGVPGAGKASAIRVTGATLLFGMCSLWEDWEREGEIIQSCTILTTEANERKERWQVSPRPRMKERNQARVIGKTKRTSRRGSGGASSGCRAWRALDLLGDKLATDLLRLGELADRKAGQSIEGELQADSGRQLLGGGGDGDGRNLGG